MKRITFKPPYRVGRKSGTTVLDSNGIEVVNFRDEEKAQEYADFLNNKEKLAYVGLGKPLNSIIDEALILHKPLPINFVGGHSSGKPWLMDEMGVFPSAEKTGKSNLLISEETRRIWEKLNKESADREPCCDENNPCACATFSPNMASPEDVRDFLDNRKIKVTKPDKISIFIMALKKIFSMSNLLPRKKKYKR